MLVTAPAVLSGTGILASRAQHRSYRLLLIGLREDKDKAMEEREDGMAEGAENRLCETEVERVMRTGCRDAL